MTNSLGLHDTGTSAVHFPGSFVVALVHKRTGAVLGSSIQVTSITEIEHYPVDTVHEGLLLIEFFHSFMKISKQLEARVPSTAELTVQLQAFNGEAWEEWQNSLGQTADQILAELEEELKELS